MSKKRWLVYRIIICLGVFFEIIWLFFTFMCEKTDAPNTFDNIYFTGFIVFFILSIIDVIIMIEIPCHAKKPKPKKYSLKQNNYQEFSSYLENRLKLYDYEYYDSNDYAKFYRKEIKTKISYIIDVKTKELTEENFEELYNEYIFPVIKEDFNIMKLKRFQLCVTMLISVDRITPMFYKYVDSEDIDILFYKFPVGISFGSNQIYLTGDESVGFKSSKKMVTEIKEILEIEDKKKASE